jgi:F0F1-type ATP synthase assembly protein I
MAGMGPAADGGPSGSELLGMGAMLAAAVVVPLVAGIAVDRALHTAPWFLLIGLSVGIVAASAVTYTRFRRYL